MELRVTNQAELRKFALMVTVAAILGNASLQALFLPAELLRKMLLPSTMITVMLAAPISFFIGTKMLDVQKLSEKLKYAANHDHLTGTSTRMNFYSRLQSSTDPPFTLIIADIDHFKSINDRFGHQAGDAALRQFAGILSRNCRASDIVARFGGEEFVILLQESEAEEGFAAALRLSQRIREKPIILNGKPIQITASFGVDVFSEIADLDMALAHADRALYRAKKTGRDRVCRYDAAKDGIDSASAAAE